jgi:hypothetical protein
MTSPKPHLTTIQRTDAADVARLEVHYWRMRVCELITQQEAIAVNLADATGKLRTAQAAYDDVRRVERMKAA